MVDKQQILKSSPKMSVAQVISEAWYFVKGLKWLFLWIVILSIIILPAIMMALMFSLKMIISVILPGFSFAAMLLVYKGLKLIYFFFLWYLFATLLSLALRQTLGLPLTLFSAFSDIMRVKGKIFLLAMLLFFAFGITTFSDHLLTYSGLLGLMIQGFIFTPLVYLNLLVIVFVLPLIISKGSEMQYAFSSAFKMINKYWLQVIICFLFLSIINSFCWVKPLFAIVLLWTVPLFFTMISVLFKNAYSLQSSLPRNENMTLEA